VIYQTLDNTDYVAMRLMWLDREGRIAQLLGEGRNFWGLAISPSGDSIAVTQDDSVFSYDAGGENLRLTTYPAVEYGAVWAPDGRRFAFGSIRNGAEEVFLGSVEPGEGDLLIAAPPDGRYLLVRREDALSVDIWRYDFEQETFSALIASPRYDEYQAQLSPDGEWVAYTSTEGGQGDVYVATFPGLENRVRFPGGSQPRWRADGQELYYLTVDGSLMMAPRSVSGSFRPADAARLFDMDRPSAGVRGGYLHYDVSPDGQRFLVITPGSSGVLSAYQNWQTALE
jgi:Tol biopolymer transport system component